MTTGAPALAAHPVREPATRVLWTASWPALAAWGAGLILLALGAGALTLGDGRPWTILTAVLLLLLGAGGLASGTAWLARGRAIAPRMTLTAALIAMVAAGGAMVADPAHVSVLAVGAAWVLLIVVGAASGRAIRRAARRTASPNGRYGVVGLLLGAFLVAALVTPALGATEAGRLAPDHSTHDLVVDQHGH